MKIINYLKLEDHRGSFEQDLINFRRHLHRHPELSFREFETTRLIRENLEQLGIEIVDLGLETGVVGILHGAKPGPTVALRGDIDALPISELNEIPWKSENENIMHACGHDIHTTVVMGAARMLSQNKDQLEGNVVFVFQPAEEVNEGARLLIARGLFEKIRIDRIIGLHNNPMIPWGKIAVKPGGLMAAVDTLRFTLKGTGGHGGVPHLTRDPIVGAGAVIMNLQSIVSRNISPLDHAVISLGTIQGGTANNVISEAVHITGTVRSFRPETRDLLRDRIHEIIHSTARAYGLTADIEYIYHLPAVNNPSDLAESARIAVTESLGEDFVVLPEPSTGGEDFALYMEQIPGFFFWLGVGNEAEGMNHFWHSPRFNGDDRSLLIGSAAMANMALHYLNELKGDPDEKH